MAPSAASAGRCRRSTRSTCPSLSGVTLYEPEELVLSAKAGTPLAEIEKLLAENGQQLAFEPMDYGPLLGGEPDAARIGGVLAANLVRSAPAEGGRRARPHPRHRGGVRPRRGVQVRRPRGQERHRLRPLQADGRLMGHAGRAHRRHLQGAAGRRDRNHARHARPARRRGGGRHGAGARLQRRSVERRAPAGTHRRAGCWRRAWPAARRRCCARRFRAVGRLPDGDAERPAQGGSGTYRSSTRTSREHLWRDIRDCAPFADGTEKPVWRVSMAPSEGHQMVLALRMEAGADAFYDWQGGLVWLRMERRSGSRDRARAW